MSIESAGGSPGPNDDPVSPDGLADTTETMPDGGSPGGPGGRRRGAADAGLRALRSSRRFIGVLIALIVMIGVFTFSQERFLTYRNFELILRTTSVLFMVSVGNTYVLLTAGFDLSVGSMLSLGGIALAMMLSGGWNEWLAIVMALALTTALGGLVNGVLIGMGKLSFFVVTLATLSLFRGITYVWTSGMTQRVESEAVATLGDGKIAGLSVPILLMVGVLLISVFVLHFTRFGRAVYAVGGNREAARLSGINVPVVIITVYAISGLLAGLGGVIQAGRLAAAAPVAGTGLELSAAAAVLLGGTSFSGGSGGVGGTLVGVLFIGVLRNGLGLSGVSAFWQEIVTGLILITAISIDRISQARSG